MQNDRPIEDANLKAGLAEVQKVMRRRGLAGACMLVAPREVAFTYVMATPWSAISEDPNSPLGLRIKASAAKDGKEVAHIKIQAAMHIICQLCDFGTQTAFWMEQFKDMMRKAGVDFDHTSFGGAKLGGLTDQGPNAKRPGRVPPDAVTDLTKALIDDGNLIEAGFLSLRHIAIAPDASDAQLKEMRMSFFAGAQHVFAALTSLDADDEPTAADLGRMDAVYQELDRFLATFKAEHGISE